MALPVPPMGMMLQHPQQHTAGQPDNNTAEDSGTDTDDEGRLIQQAATIQRQRAEPKPPLPPGAKPKITPKRPAGAVTLRTLIESGIILPGEKVLYVEYKGVITWGDLTPDGQISHNGHLYESPSAFSIYLKRQVNPDRKADDGWKAVKYGGKLLEHFKEQYLRKQILNQAERIDTPTASVMPSPSTAGGGILPSPQPSVTNSPAPAPIPSFNTLRPAMDGEPPSKRMRVDIPSQQVSGEQRVDDSPTDAPCNGSSAKPAGFKIKIKFKGAPSPSGAPGQQADQPWQAATASTSRPAGPTHTGAPLHSAPSPSMRPHSLSTSGSGQHLHATGGIPRTPHYPSECSEGPGRHPVPCGSYTGAPGTGHPGSQPFRVMVAECVELVMDLHAHCSLAEVCGLLGGMYDDRTRTLTVLRAFPVRESHDQGPAAGEVDLDGPAQVRELMRSVNLSCVGWYHSHATFGSAPSVTDMRKQLSEQRQYLRPDGLEPYVAVIVSPYDPQSQGLSSAINWFNTGQSMLAGQVAALPMALTTEPLPVRDAHMDILKLVATQFQVIAKRYSTRPSRAQLQQPWCPGVSCLDKLTASLISRLPAMFDSGMKATYSRMLSDMLSTTFSISRTSERMEFAPAPHAHDPTRGAYRQPEGYGAGSSGHGMGGCNTQQHHHSLGEQAVEDDEETAGDGSDDEETDAEVDLAAAYGQVADMEEQTEDDDDGNGMVVGGVGAYNGGHGQAEEEDEETGSDEEDTAEEQEY